MHAPPNRTPLRPRLFEQPRRNAYRLRVPEHPLSFQRCSDPAVIPHLQWGPLVELRCHFQFYGGYGAAAALRAHGSCS